MNILNNQFSKPFAISLLAMSILTACGGSNSSTTPTPLPEPTPVPIEDPSEPTFSASLFNAESASVTNEYFPLKPGTTLIYEGINDDGELERIEFNISHETRIVDGVESRIVVDRNYTDDELNEETFDWYAQDTNGNVWYMGEDSVEIEDGEILTSTGSWESGLDIDNVGQLATAGILMKVAPFTIDDTYQQEFYPSVAEDQAKILATEVDVTLNSVLMPDGEEQTNFVTLQTLEWVSLDSDPISTEEHKYFASGIGQILETNTSGGERVELVQILDDTMPNITPDNFTNSTLIDNKYFPLVPGTTYRFKTTEGEDEELILYEVLDETREVMGITTRVVRDRVYIDGDENTGTLVEDTRDWFAQDNDGNVWYMGEEVDNYDDDGAFANNDGSWEAGIDEAQPGIQMKKNPLHGDSYHQEYLIGEAEDLAAITATDAEIELDNGMAYTTLKVKEWNPLEEGSTEYKYYAAGIGFIREEKLDDNGEVEEGIEFDSIDIEQGFETLSLNIVNNEEEEEAQIILAGSAEPVFFKYLRCYAPNGMILIDAVVDEDSGDFSDFQYDTAKTALDELELSYPAGNYWCTARTPDNTLLIGTTELTYEFSRVITPTSPENESENVSTQDLTLSWDSLEDAKSIIVDIENSLTGDSMGVELQSNKTSFTIPDGFLEGGIQYEVGFESIHDNGNITVYEDFIFTTAGVASEEEDEDANEYGDFENLELFVVFNATDDDAQLFLEAEALDDTTLLALTITDSNGNDVHNITFKDEEDLGMTDALYETSEPSIGTLESQFPAGEYTYAGVFLNDDDEEFEGEGKITLDYDVLTVPTITYPLEDQDNVVTSNPLTIMWTGVSENADALILEIEAEGTYESFSIDLPTDATEFTLPVGWLKPGKLYVIDLEVVHENSNITVVDVEFDTK